MVADRESLTIHPPGGSFAIWRGGGRGREQFGWYLPGAWIFLTTCGGPVFHLIDP
jgi:hypothetical protein